ncbi:hypothetical protein DX130_17790 [Paenibacillus paeoniae]|uniref:DeoR-like transcriptional repressor C-terminal sensor domain-containing protein n=1 Tax=Paenibacillus paeoniae TaxID=2292705 RepID=A0A371PEN6_9BACL|nr:hypothetical protein DX130_17790 [Paenibacillus paeoniae]
MRDNPLFIGQFAANRVGNNEMIYLDVSTTIHAIAPFLEEKEISIVTNSIDIAFTLSHFEHITMHFLGGTFNKSSRHMTGFDALEKLQDYHFRGAALCTGNSGGRRFAEIGSGQYRAGSFKVVGSRTGLCG